jgi:hypothetical protein
MTGAPTPDPFTARQLRAVEQLVYREFSRLAETFRPPGGEDHRDIRLAKTVEASSSYPTSGNTFWIRFLDCAFNPLSAGSTTLSEVERTDEGDSDDAADVLAREINGLYVPEGTIVKALWQRGVSGAPSSYGEWWIIAPTAFKNQLGYTSAGISARSGTTPGSGTVQPKKLSSGSIANDGSTITVYSWAQNATQSSAYIYYAYDMYGTPWLIAEDCP